MDEEEKQRRINFLLSRLSDALTPESQHHWLTSELTISADDL